MSESHIDPVTTATDTKPANRPTQPTRKMMPTWAWVSAGVLLGVLLLLAVRFVTYSHAHTHYHANFAVFLDGKRQEFKEPQYYQEVKICNLSGTSPQSRTHMHNSENGVIHVHDEAVTWGQFFENLGWIVGPDFIRTDTELLAASDTNKLSIILNGQDLTDVSTITNQVIGNKDRLLLSYGPPDTAVLDNQFKSVANSAAKYNATKDPASCGSEENPTTQERLKNLF